LTQSAGDHQVRRAGAADEAAGISRLPRETMHALASAFRGSDRGGRLVSGRSKKTGARTS
jgi:hypothetical protein